MKQNNSCIDKNFRWIFNKFIIINVIINVKEIKFKLMCNLVTYNESIYLLIYNIKKYKKK